MNLKAAKKNAKFNRRTSSTAPPTARLALDAGSTVTIQTANWKGSQGSEGNVLDLHHCPCEGHGFDRFNKAGRSFQFRRAVRA